MKLKKLFTTKNIIIVISILIFTILVMNYISDRIFTQALLEYFAPQ